MSFFNLLSNKTTDPNLLQGQEFKEYERIYNNNSKRDLELLQMTSSPSLNSIIESLLGDDSIKSNSNYSNVSISKLEDEFNRTLVKYNNAYKDFMENNLQKNIDEIKKSNYYKNLQRLNNKLISLAKVINNELKNIIVVDGKLKQDLETQKDKLNSYIHALDNDRELMNKTSKEYNVIKGENESVKLKLISNKYQYIVWFILAITFVFITIYIINDDNISNIRYIILLLIGLILLYIIGQNIYNTYI